MLNFSSPVDSCVSACSKQFHAATFTLLCFPPSHFRFLEHELQVDCFGTENVFFKIKLNLSPKEYLVSVAFVVPFCNAKQECIVLSGPFPFPFREISKEQKQSG